MSESFEFREVTHFTAGAVGDPGQRVFYLQVGDEGGHVSVKLEKQQVMALAQFLRTVLEDLPSPPAASAAAAVPLREPTAPAWVVGQIAVGVSEADAEVVLVVDERVDDDLDDDLDDDDPFDDQAEGARLRAHINVTQAASFIATSDELMERGRPPCRLCGQPLDPQGHACPRLN
ncbi:MAG: DUF3090 family protein [Acidimicrobiales bacterium]